MAWVGVELFRVNRRSIIWLAPRRQGHYEKTAQTINSPFFVPPLTTLRCARETAIKASRGVVALLLFVSKMVQIHGA